MDRPLQVRAFCRRGCGEWVDIDVVALMAKLGPDYSLWNRRCRCRITPGCQGWNMFGYSTGTWFKKFYDDSIWLRPGYEK